MKKLFKMGAPVLGMALACLLVACGTNKTSSSSTGEPHVHSFGQWTVTEADCTREGVRERVCDCGEKETQVIAATGHQQVLIPGKAATCTEAGLTDGKYCAVCNTVLTRQEQIAATGHQQGTAPGKAATCTEAGLTEKKYCTVCNAVLTPQEQIPALGHKETVVPGKAATCTEAGMTNGKRCERCNTVLEEQKTIQALEHAFENYISNQDATCLTDGTETATCTRCQKQDTRRAEGSALGHTVVTIPAVEARCTVPGLTSGAYCATCGQTLSEQYRVPARDHNYSGGFCTRCGVAQIRTSKGLTYALNGDGASYRVTGLGSCGDRNIVIPEVYNGLPVTAVAARAFASCENIYSIVLQNGMTSIGEEAFSGCFGLTSLTLPDGLEEIGAYAFQMCSGLQTIKMPHGLRQIGKGAFWFCHNLKGVYITDLPGWCAIEFDGIGANPLSVGGSLYIDGRLVTELIIPDSVEKIGDHAFAMCTSLKKVYIGAKTSQIGSKTFYFCDRLTEVTIGNGVQTIGSSAFEGCAMLQCIDLPASVQSIGQGAYTQCSSLKTITVHPDNKVYHSTGYCLIETATKTLIRGCDSSSLPTDGSVTTIEANAFSGCMELQQILIPASVNCINGFAFNNCPVLTQIIYESTQTRWNAITKEEKWLWDVGAYTISFLCKDPPLELIRSDITLSPSNGTSFDLFQLIRGREDFDRTLVRCTSADGTLIRVEGTTVTALGNSSRGVVVTLTYGDQSVTCLVRAEQLGDYSLSRTDVTLTLGREGYEEFTLKLLDANGNAVGDCQWKFSNDFPKCCEKEVDSQTGAVKIIAKAVTTDLSNGTYVKVWTVYGGKKYECIIRVVRAG